MPYVEQSENLSDIVLGKTTIIKTTSDKAVIGKSVKVEPVMAAAERSGLLREKCGRIGGRVSPTLVAKAKARTGIKTDTDLIEFALANEALEDNVAEQFKASRGRVDADIKLGF